MNNWSRIYERTERDKSETTVLGFKVDEIKSRREDLIPWLVKKSRRNQIGENWAMNRDVLQFSNLDRLTNLVPTDDGGLGWIWTHSWLGGLRSAVEAPVCGGDLRLRSTRIVVCDCTLFDDVCLTSLESQIIFVISLRLGKWISG
jgi:hypothetical protein